MLRILILSGLFFVSAVTVQAGNDPEFGITISPRKELSRSIFSKESRKLTNELIPPSTLADAISSVGGLQLRKYGASGSLVTFSIRGGNASQSLVAVEDVPLNSAQNGQMDLSLFPVSGFDSVDIVKGGGSSLFGANAASGFVNFFSTRPRHSTLNLSCGGGSFGRLYLEGDANILASPSFFLRSLVRIERAKNDFVYTNYGTNTRRINAGYTNFYFHLQADYGRHDWNTKLTAFYNSKKAGQPGDRYLQNPVASQEDDFLFTSWKTVFYRPLLTEFLLSYAQSYNRYRDPIYLLGPLDARHHNGQIFTSLAQEWERNWFSMRYGLEDRWNHIDSTELKAEPRNLLSQFLTCQADLFGKRLKLSGRGRTEFSSVYGFVYTWNTGFNAMLPYRMTLRFNAGTSFREPTFNDLFWPEDAFAKGNPHLLPERSFSIDAGLEKSVFSFVSLKGSIYQNDFLDLIVWTQAAGGKWSPENVSKARYRGGEVEVSFAWKDLFRSEFRYSKLHAINREPGQYFGKSIPYKPFDLLSFSLTAKKGRWGVHSRYQYTGFSYSTKANTVSSSGIVPAAMQWDLGLACQILPSMKASVSCENLLDQRFLSADNRPMPGRSFAMNINYKFTML
jgi:vitamin B12 transporter